MVVAIPDTVLSQLNKLAEAIEKLMAPYVQPLSNSQRRTQLKMGPKSVAYVTECRDYGTATPDYVPGFVDVADMTTNLATVAQLSPIARRLAGIAFDLVGTNMVAGGSARNAANLIYGRLQEAAENNQPGGQAAYNALREFFESSKHGDDDDDDDKADQ